MLQYVTRLVTTGADAYGSSPTVCFEKPTMPRFLDGLNALVAQSREKHGGYLTLRLSLPFRGRSTGPRSQNNRFYGHCEDLAEQVYKDVRAKQRVHDGMLRMAVSEGYPTYLDINGVESPLPSAESSVEQLGLVCRVLQRYADIHNLWLHEYIKEGPLKNLAYKSIGGRSYEEMMRCAPELNAELGVRLIEYEEEK